MVGQAVDCFVETMTNDEINELRRLHAKELITTDFISLMRIFNADTKSKECQSLRSIDAIVLVDLCFDQAD